VIHLPLLDPCRPDIFPPVQSALDEPDGLLAAGGDLSPARLLAAYRNGIFAWYSDQQPILWWSPASRTVFDTANVHLSRRLARWLRRCDWEISADTSFAAVVRACAASRARQHGTWITDDMFDAYCGLHAAGHAHSIEVRDGEHLVGGIYGIAIGRMFFGESMFSAITNGSKVALLALCRVLHDWNYPLLDAQVASDHLFTLGAREMARAKFCDKVTELTAAAGMDGAWSGRFPSFSPADLAG
jgi:leucyl/phenylalanyl-tRNA--protein transferase